MIRFAAAVLLLGFLAATIPSDVMAAEPKDKVSQQSFASPEEAAAALVSAAKTSDAKMASAILGPGGKQLIYSGDETADKNARSRFIQLYEEKNQIINESETRVVLEVGNDAWPFPIPIVASAKGWRFDTEEGKREILNRRIGRNELSAIQTCLAYVDAQREYASKDRDGDGLLEYAQRFGSEPGKQNGLYWEVGAGEEQSPLGPLVARAMREGYTKKGSADKPSAYHGYYYRILTAQGRNAPGGACDYVVRGRMIGGFALLAYPAQYGSSGIMSFIVSHSGKFYEKDLGSRTPSAAQAMKRFDPDKTWREVDPKEG